MTASAHRRYVGNYDLPALQKLFGGTRAGEDPGTGEGEGEGGLGIQAFRAKQVTTQLYQRLAGSYDEMTDLPSHLRRVLAEALPIDPLRVVTRQDDEAGSTKLAFEPIERPNRQGVSGVIEAVIMRDASRDSRTICISTQVGCAMGCQFCASGLDGLVRNLTTAEILAQVWHAARILREEGYGGGEHEGRGRRQRKRGGGGKEGGATASPTITNLVFMGVGEPLANIPALFPALRTLTAPWGFGMSPRRITISTVGLIAGIAKLTALDLPINLAISLHAADDQTRQRIMPTRPGKAPAPPEPSVTAKLAADEPLVPAVSGERATAPGPGGGEEDGPTPEVDQLLDAGDRYFMRTGREVTLEFILLPEANGDHADKLADLIARHPDGRYNVNVIPYNHVEEFSWREATAEEIRGFLARLRERGVNAHARKRMGYGIDGACGQLRLTRTTQ